MFAHADGAGFEVAGANDEYGLRLYCSALEIFASILAALVSNQRRNSNAIEKIRWDASMR